MIYIIKNDLKEENNEAIYKKKYVSRSFTGSNSHLLQFPMAITVTMITA